MASFASMLANLKAANSPSTQNFPPPSFKPDDPMITRTSSLNSVNILRSGRKNATPAPAPAPAPATATAPASTPSNIAICATIVDNFPHSDIWQKWAQSTNPSKYTASLHLHPKNPDNIQNSYLKSICIDSSIQPDWNDVRIVQAMLLLIKKALENPNTRFLILCTESCLPITNLADCAEKLTKTNKSWLRHYDKNSATSKFDELQCFGPLEKYIPSNVISKALPGWICLRRDHAEAILGLPKNLEAELFPVFKGVWAPEEMFFPTALNLAGCLNDEEVENRMVIFAGKRVFENIRSD